MNVGDGKLTDVLIEEEYWRDDTGIQKFHCLTVWCDPDMQKTIEKVPGVSSCYTYRGKTCYQVYVDPRYDRQWVIAEIEAAARCKE